MCTNQNVGCESLAAPSQAASFVEYPRISGWEDFLGQIAANMDFHGVGLLFSLAGKIEK
jgi:hypothetical protein